MQGILLAAGRGRRFGANKLLHPLEDGTPMALAAARNLRAALTNVLAVVASEESELVAMLERAGLRVAICLRSGEGMGASLACGVAESREADGWLIALADMPWIKPETIGAVAGAVGNPRAIAAPVYRGRRGHPVAFGRAYGPDLMGLAGDEGGRRLLETFSRDVVHLPCADPEVLRDIDLPAQIGR
jgi:molybdenum cofactor cytidylyltransferase